MKIAEWARSVRDSADTVERQVIVAGALVVAILAVAVASGVLQLGYLIPTLAVAGMWVLLTMALNVQWGYAGLINFSVAAFWGLGIYSAAVLTSPNSPLGVELSPVVALLCAIIVSAVVATLIGIPTLKLRADYLAIVTLGFAEIIRMLIQNEDQITAGNRGLSVPSVLSGLPLTQGATNLLIITIGIVAVYLVLRHIHRSPWGRILRTIRSDEELAAALGRNTYWFKMQAFVLGSVLMAIAGVFYAHHIRFVIPTDLQPITTFYVWVAVILGGTGSNRGAVVGGLAIVLIREGPRFINDFGMLPFSPGPFRLLLVGVLIIGLIRYRPAGILPPRQELIWPPARDDETKQSGNSGGSNPPESGANRSLTDGGDRP